MDIITETAAIQILTGEGHSPEIVSTAMDSLVRAGLSAEQTDDDNHLIDADDMETLRDQITIWERENDEND